MFFDTIDDYGLITEKLELKQKTLEREPPKSSIPNLCILPSGIFPLVLKDRFRTAAKNEELSIINLNDTISSNITGQDLAKYKGIASLHNCLYDFSRPSQT